MPKKARVSYAKIFKTLKSLPIFYPDGSLKKEIQPVWKQACDILDKKISRKNLYLKVFNNLGKLKERLQKNAIKNEKIPRHSKFLIVEQITDDTSIANKENDDASFVNEENDDSNKIFESGDNDSLGDENEDFKRCQMMMKLK